MLNESTMKLAVEAVEFVRTAYYKNCANDPDGMVNDLKELDDALKVLREVQQMVDGDNDVLVVPKIQLQYVIEKMCNEINGQLSENEYKVLYQEDVEDVNRVIATFGVDANMCEYWEVEDDEGDEE